MIIQPDLFIDKIRRYDLNDKQTSRYGEVWHIKQAVIIIRNSIGND